MTSKQNITAIIKDKKGRVLSIGKNSYTKTHPLQALHATKTGLSDKVYRHAEIDAIVKCKDIDKAYSIEVFRLGNSGRYLNAKPCPICQSALNSTKIKQIFHT
jgi:tRNA(Arg) A34 adenosine deaminase TadA